MTLSLWLQLVLVVEGFALAGILVALAQAGTRWVFAIGFLVMLPVAVLMASHGSGPAWRACLVVALVAVYVARMGYVLIAWFGNTGAAKLGPVPIATRIALPLVLTNTCGWLYCAPFLWAASRPETFAGWDGLALILYAAGTVLHVGADWQKRRFRQDPANRGRLLEHGLWGLSRHPNYLGDIMVYLSFAALSASPFGLLAPLAAILQYAFDAIPKNEAMNARRYGEAWRDYARRVRMIVPYVV